MLVQEDGKLGSNGLALRRHRLLEEEILHALGNYFLRSFGGRRLPQPSEQERGDQDGKGDSENPNASTAVSIHSLWHLACSKSEVPPGVAAP
jgi:hypothetical protein